MRRRNITPADGSAAVVLDRARRLAEVRRRLARPTPGPVDAVAVDDRAWVASGGDERAPEPAKPRSLEADPLRRRVVQDTAPMPTVAAGFTRADGVDATGARRVRIPSFVAI